MIKISNLTKLYGKKKALDNISFTVEDGEVVGLLGPNGAGKSTTMNVLTGYTSFNEGSVLIGGINILEDPKAAKRKIGYLPEFPPLYTDMIVWDYLSFVYDLKKVRKNNKKVHIQSIVDEVGINNVKKRRIANLSKGYKQRVGLAGALIGDPEVLILDEPTVGLDPRQIIEIRNLIVKLGKSRTVILSSHILQEISAVCERVIIIRDGRIAAEKSTRNMTKQHTGRKKLHIRVSGAEEEIKNVLNGLEGVTDLRSLGAYDETSYDFEVVTEVGDASDFSRRLFFAFAEKEMPVIMQKFEESSLEDVFLEVTEKDAQKEDENESDT